MSPEPESPLREFRVLIFADGKFGPEFAVLAHSRADARAFVIAQHGDGEISIWNKEEAKKIR